MVEREQPRPCGARHHRKFVKLILCCGLLFACGVKADAPQPWTHQRFDDDPEEFSFAVIGDLTGGERPGIFDVAVSSINLLRPAFVMSVGDLIDGITRDEQEVIRQWERFDSQARRIIAPFFYVVGNHDIASIAMRRIWEQRLGRRYYHFVYKNVLFMVLDSEDFPPEVLEKNFEHIESLMNKYRAGDTAPMQEYVQGYDFDGTMDGAISKEQVAYFRKAMADHPSVRWAFMFLHRPLWQGDGDEGYRQIESAVPNGRFTAIAGHIHSYRYSKKGEQQSRIRLGTTGGIWLHGDARNNFDHIMMVRMTDSGPVIANLKLDGILDQEARLPASGGQHCFSEQRCREVR